MVKDRVTKHVMTIMIQVEMDDQVTVVQLKMVLYDQETLQIHQINANNEIQDTILMIIKILDTVIVEMASKLLKNNVTIMTQTQVMAEAQYV